MRHKVLTALLTFRTLLLLVIAIQLSAGFRGSKETFLEKCGESMRAETYYDVHETLREPADKNGQEDTYKDLYRFPLVESSLGNCSTG